MSNDTDAERIMGGPNPRQRRGIVWTAVTLGLVALAVYVTFIMVTAAQS